jgi:hypothetical protein
MTTICKRLLNPGMFRYQLAIWLVTIALAALGFAGGFGQCPPAFAALSFVPSTGTGGISVVDGGSLRDAPRPGLPEVTVHPSGFSIKTAKGVVIQVPTGRQALDRFLTLWWAIHDPRNGYFSRLDVPFHSIETFIVEAPDYGHLTTSETMSFWVWLEAAYARITGDYSLLHYAMDITEKYAIPQFQPTVGAYQSSSPALYAREESLPSLYPVPFDPGARSGRDPLSDELRSVYGVGVYGMHWLIDTNNWYGFGAGDQPTFINTFQRGAEESVWETVPHPSVDDFRFGSPRSGYLGLFAADQTYARQWRYTNAPDADARLIQAIYEAWENAAQRGVTKELGQLPEKAAKMGDFLRYAMFDKYFKKMGCDSPYCAPGTGEESAHYLLAWYYAWGGSSPQDAGAWSWRIGSSHAHFGYQNPMTAYVLSSQEAFRPKTQSGLSMWAKSLGRQIELYQWLQSTAGAIAGGVTNSYDGQYSRRPAGLGNFYGMVFEQNPVYRDPGSNTWFGWQTWSMQRVAQYYLASGDTRVSALLDKWVDWVMKETRLTSDGGYAIPSTLAWQGTPSGNPEGGTFGPGNLSVTIVDTTRDVGVAGSLAKTLLQYVAAQAKHKGEARSDVQNLATELLTRMWNVARDDKGLSVPEARGDYKRMYDRVFIPAGFDGTTPDGVRLDQNVTFASLRPKYKNDPDFVRTGELLARGETPIFRYHRFWAQVEAALAYAELAPSLLTP